MMDEAGEALTTESIREAVAFRQTVSRLHAEFGAKGEWFFNCLQPPEVFDPKTGRSQPFHEADPERLVSDPLCWGLTPGADWHGFDELEDGWCMLDPIKVSVTTPGMSMRAGLLPVGVPASILTAYLADRGIVVEKTTDFAVLFLFSMGVTNGKWGTLLNALLDFKKDYDANTPLARSLPGLMAAHADRYAGLGLRDLADLVFGAVAELGTTVHMSNAFAVLPKPDMAPIDAYERLVRGEVEKITLDALAGRTLATGIVPYPPGIPLLMPGENAGAAKDPLIGYLKALEAFDARFPGFTHDTHGVEVEDGVHHVLVIKG
jgi:lysine decarboxylase/arginine decarboxylase